MRLIMENFEEKKDEEGKANMVLTLLDNADKPILGFFVEYVIVDDDIEQIMKSEFWYKDRQVFLDISWEDSRADALELLNEFDNKYGIF